MVMLLLFLPLFLRLDPAGIAVVVGLGLAYGALLLGLFGLGLWLVGRRRPVIGVAVMVAVLGWCFGPTVAASLRDPGLAALVESWQIAPDPAQLSEGRILVLEFDGVDGVADPLEPCWQVCSALLQDTNLAEVHVLTLPPDALAEGGMPVDLAALAGQGRALRVTRGAPESGMNGVRPLVVAPVDTLPDADLVILEDRHGILVARSWATLMPDLARPAEIGAEAGSGPGPGEVAIIDSLHVWSAWPEPGQDPRPLARRIRASHAVPKPFVWPIGLPDIRYLPEFRAMPPLPEWLCEVGGGTGPTCPPP